MTKHFVVGITTIEDIRLPYGVKNAELFRMESCVLYKYTLNKGNKKYGRTERYNSE